ncbi:hypothetical protein KCP73_18480 [Salmonella enterica subsp. enterica]|nr:hypothetical protein KCP73_18480 [Salmonella enterica subsp. enterica]
MAYGLARRRHQREQSAAFPAARRRDFRARRSAGLQRGYRQSGVYQRFPVADFDLPLQVNSVGYFCAREFSA